MEAESSTASMLLATLLPSPKVSSPIRTGRPPLRASMPVAPGWPPSLVPVPAAGPLLAPQAPPAPPRAPARASLVAASARSNAPTQPNATTPSDHRYIGSNEEDLKNASAAAAASVHPAPIRSAGLRARFACTCSLLQSILRRIARAGSSYLGHASMRCSPKRPAVLPFAPRCPPCKLSGPLRAQCMEQSGKRRPACAIAGDASGNGVRLHRAARAADKWRDPVAAVQYLL